MDCAFGFVGKDYTILVTDCSVPRSIVLMKEYEDKVAKVGPFTAFALTGEASDTKNFSEYIDRNIKWYEIRNGRLLTNDAIANFTRNELALALRSGPYYVNLLQGGYDEPNGPCLYYMDYLGSLQKLNTAAHGYCSYFLFSIFDRNWKEDITLEEGIKLVETCIEQLHKRFLINMQAFIVKVIDKKGIRKIDIFKEHKLKAIDDNEYNKENYNITQELPGNANNANANAKENNNNNNNNNNNENKQQTDKQ